MDCDYKNFNATLAKCCAIVAAMKAKVNAVGYFITANASGASDPRIACLIGGGGDVGGGRDVKHLVSLSLVDVPLYGQGLFMSTHKC